MDSYWSCIFAIFELESNCLKRISLLVFGPTKWMYFLIFHVKHLWTRNLKIFGSNKYFDCCHYLFKLVDLVIVKFSNNTIWLFTIMSVSRTVHIQLCMSSHHKLIFRTNSKEKNHIFTPYKNEFSNEYLFHYSLVIPWFVCFLFEARSIIWILFMHVFHSHKECVIKIHNTSLTRHNEVTKSKVIFFSV